MLKDSPMKTAIALIVFAFALVPCVAQESNDNDTIKINSAQLQLIVNVEIAAREAGVIEKILSLIHI